MNCPELPELIEKSNDEVQINSQINELKRILGERKIRIMEFCGGHTHSFFNTGLVSLIENCVELVHGPGCPVCVLPPSRVAMLLDLIERRDDVIVATYADMMRIKTLDGRSLKNFHHKTKMVYSALECVKLAQENPSKEIVFAGIGFETTTPPTALLLKKIIDNEIHNLSIFCNHVLTAPAIRAVMQSLDEEMRPDGIIGPGHVSMVTGSEHYLPIVEEIKRPIAIAGFEPYQLMQSLLSLASMIVKSKVGLSNDYSSVVSTEGNKSARDLIDMYFELREEFVWRGVGSLPESALKIKKEFSKFDAEIRFEMNDVHQAEHPACRCPAILMGKAKPLDCKLYAKACTPDNPLGTCMVSSEGACSAYYNNGIGL
ncbi:MAG: hydrogenase formation protein HypD [Deltaproteobacteria bacterium]|nr:MAG: hydrogenase formation protein HypD [Deltaproteobacteria bacterium]TNF32031.1 MAG: hydrogenase formation protein HypD [Deltaproteobacteria bacterium]